MRWLLLLGLLLPSLQAAVDGDVMNLTTGKPQPGAGVTLYSVSQHGR